MDDVVVAEEVQGRALPEVVLALIALDLALGDPPALATVISASACSKCQRLALPVDVMANEVLPGHARAHRATISGMPCLDVANRPAKRAEDPVSATTEDGGGEELSRVLHVQGLGHAILYAARKKTLEALSLCQASGL